MDPANPLYHAVEFAGLQPDGRVLDIGCGNGRMAVALTDYLTPEGRYEGFDVIPDCIDECRRRVGAEFPNFAFHLIDVYNKGYNPEGTVQANDLRFPYEDEQFDLAMLYSVFTHMLPEGIEHYFSEIARVLKSGGRMLATYFLLNEQSLDLLERRVGGLHFDQKFGNYRTRKLNEGTVSLMEDYVLGVYERFGPRLVHPITYSNWAAKQERPWGQDWIVAEKA
jgi:ubiquinone/menaquinone biosynthesis C-methylase UbiE